MLLNPPPTSPCWANISHAIIDQCCQLVIVTHGCKGIPEVWTGKLFLRNPKVNNFSLQQLFFNIGQLHFIRTQALDLTAIPETV